MSSTKHRGDTIASQRDDEQAEGPAPQEPRDDDKRTGGNSAFRDCRGELVWLD